MIEAKIARILSESEVVLNVGVADGVDVDLDSALIVREIPIEDPDTQELLGHVQRPVLRLSLEEVKERISVARSADWARPDGLDALVMGGAAQARRRMKIVSDQSKVTWQSVYIKVGDLVWVGDPEELERGV